MRLAKLASQKTKKNNQQKYELQQQQNNEWGSNTKGQTGGGFGKRFSGTLSILSSSNNSGSVRSSVAGVNSAQRNSFGNGSCISSSASTNNTCTIKKRKSKTTKCFSSTVFRCCLPCRGGSGSAAPATSPPHTPVPPNNSTSSKVDSTVKRKRSGKSAIELTTDGNESLIAAVKKHSLADTIGTSATTPISLKTLINDEEEDLQQHISAADIAAAKLASGILPRKAEPETLSDTSISPTTAVLQLAAGSASASSLLSTTTSLLSTTTAANTQVTFVANKTTTTQVSPITPPNTNSNFVYQSSTVEQNNIVGQTTTASTIQTTTPTSPLSPLPALTTAASSGVTAALATANTTASTTTTTSSSTASSTPSRCCCPPPQTSPLPHIKEEEESEQLLQRQHSANQDDDTLTEPTQQQQNQQQQQQSQLDQLSPFTANPSGSSDSCTSLSATAVTTATTSSITGGGCTPQEFTNTSTPSPRIKHKFRKQHKSGWSRIILAPNSSLVPVGGGSGGTCGVANSSETLASSSNNSSSAATVSAAIAAAQATRLASSSATALATQQSSSSQLLPASKMQAEQGSIGDLQKYHSRYLKNRRHTLANVRSALQCQEDDEDCREQFMHPAIEEHKLKRRSAPSEVLTEYWLDKGERFVAYKDGTADKPVRNKAQNIIFFLGDGMSLATLAATRVYLGGEEKTLSFETFADTGLAKTYALDRLVPDSACSATAFLCGVKANYGTIGVSGHVKRGDCEASKNKAHYVDSIAKWALEAKRSVGFVTTAKVTDATPAALYAHTADRDWENDKKVKKDCGKNSGVSDIALQLMQGEVGKHFKVIMGGGKSQFIDEDLYDEGKRIDGRNLVQEFLNENPNNMFVENREDLMAVNTLATKRLLGLFNDGHMKYNLKALDSKKNKQPTLSEMTEKAIKLLRANNNNGYFLFVEAGRIDTAHHNNKAKLALDETAQLSEAVELARRLTDMENTLIVVSADHSHTMSISGYAQRGNDITKLASLGEDELPYMTLSYANGPGFKQFYNTKKNYREDPREVLAAQVEEEENDYDLQFPATAPMESETHGGEDVPVYASGPWSDLFSGVYEQSTLPYLMAYAGCFGPGEKAC